MNPISNPYTSIFAESSYSFCSEKIQNGRLVIKYVLKEETVAAIDLAVNAINRLLKEAKNLCPIFNKAPESKLRENIKQNRCLIINGEAVCLTQEQNHPLSISPKYVDRYFSCGLLSEPVKCDKNHYFENSSLVFWQAVKGQDVCPVGSHKNKTWQKDNTMDEKILWHKENLTDHEKEQQKMKDSIKKLEEEREKDKQIIEQTSQQVNAMMHYIQPLDPIIIGSGMGKVIINICSESVIKQLQLSAQVGKAAPYVGFFARIVCATYRAHKGDWLKAKAEAANCGIALIPTYGRPLSLAIDIFILGHDLFQVHKVVVDHNKGLAHYKISIPIQDALAALGLPRDKKPTKDEVDKAVRAQSKKSHPDIYGKIENNESTDDIGHLTQEMLNKLKDEIYQYYGWNVIAHSIAPTIPKESPVVKEEVVLDVLDEDVDPILNFLKNPEQKDNILPESLSPSKIDANPDESDYIWTRWRRTFSASRRW